MTFVFADSNNLFRVSIKFDCDVDFLEGYKTRLSSGGFTIRDGFEALSTVMVQALSLPSELDLSLVKVR